MNNTLAGTILCISLFFIFPSFALAGDGATIIFKSGASVYLNNGFKQIESGIKDPSRKKSENDYIKLELGDAPFYINLDTVAIVCRDQCKSMELLKSSRDKQK